jgi:hypothetical protein
MRPGLSHLAFCALAVTACASGAVVSQNNDPLLVMVGNGADLRYYKDVRVISDTLTGTPASHWAQLQAAYRSLGLPLTARDGAALAIASQNAQFSGRFNNQPMSKFIDCGLAAVGSQRANDYRVWLTVASQLVPSATGTTLRTSVVSKAQDQSSSTSPVQCGTTGELESLIAKQVGSETQR